MSGSIFIQLPKVTYLPGEQLNGIMYIEVTAPIPTSLVTLQISGREDVKLREVRTTTEKYGNVEETITTYYDHYGENQLFNYEFPISLSDTGSMAVGQYQVPFSLILPERLPASFSYYWFELGAQCHGDIGYNVRAFIQYGGFMGFFQSNLKTNVPFIINQPQVYENGAICGQLSKKISGVCRSKGEVKMKSYFEKNNYLAGETANLITEVDSSDLNCDIKCFKGQFMQHILLQTRTFNKFLTFKLSQINIPGTKAGSKHVGDKALKYPVQLVNCATGAYVQPSAYGSLVQNRYILKSRAEIKSGLCCQTNPTIEIEVNIFNKQMEAAQWNPPENWNPQKVDPYVAELSHEFEAQIDNNTVPTEGQQYNPNQPQQPQQGGS